MNNVVVVSDLHVGCEAALCPPSGALRDEGGRYMPSPLQRKIWAMWQYFWGVWVPEATRGEPWALVVNGDCIDGTHHGTVGQWSQNIEDQKVAAMDVLRPIVKRSARYYHIRGTEAHAGIAGQTEEAIARELGAVPNEAGQCARWELWLRLGKQKRGNLIHIAHHVGVAGSQHYESSAVMRELAEAASEAGRWRDEAPQAIVRSHRHRNIEIRVPCEHGSALAVVTAGWQGKTPFTHRMAGGRAAQPQFGGSVISLHKGELYARSWTSRLARPKEER